MLPPCILTQQQGGIEEIALSNTAAWRLDISGELSTMNFDEKRWEAVTTAPPCIVQISVR